MANKEITVIRFLFKYLFYHVPILHFDLLHNCLLKSPAMFFRCHRPKLYFIGGECLVHTVPADTEDITQHSSYYKLVLLLLVVAVVFLLCLFLCHPPPIRMPQRHHFQRHHSHELKNFF